MITKKPSDKRSTWNIAFSDLIEPATILTITIGFAFILGYIHTQAFCNRIGLHHTALGLPSSQYLLTGVSSASSLIFLLNFLITRSRQIPETLLEISSANFIAFSVVVGTLGYGVLNYQKYFISYLIALVVSCAVILVFSWRKISITHIEEFREWPWIILCSIIIFLALSANAYVAGGEAGRATIEGQNATLISFAQNESIPQEVYEKPLILVYHSDGKYFVVEKMNPAPDDPLVYIIPDNSVKFASTKSSK